MKILTHVAAGMFGVFLGAWSYHLTYCGLDFLGDPTKCVAFNAYRQAADEWIAEHGVFRSLVDERDAVSLPVLTPTPDVTNRPSTNQVRDCPRFSGPCCLCSRPCASVHEASIIRFETETQCMAACACEGQE